MIREIDKKRVKVLPGLFRERMQVNRSYLMELDTQCLLQNFYLEAGIVMPGLQVLEDPASANLHWGWEAPTCQLRGHFLGHWMAAAASLVASENDQELKAKLDHIVAELARCQELNGDGWVGSIPEKFFEKLANDAYVWSPQYVMHKTLMGLTAAYKDAGNKQALEVLSHLADWYIRWTDEMQKRNPRAVYHGEEGGMLEVWVDLYLLTKEEKYKILAERYCAPKLFRDLSDGKDALTNCHSNASIPWAQGAAKMYEATGEEKWKELTEQFWKCAVTDRGMYSTGGANSGEFWVPPYRQGEYLGVRNQEFCTVYNMVRLADYLYRWTKDTKYADYIERNLYNGFLAQQNVTTGTPTYFLPLQAGSKKKWGSKRHDFWCCHGTMVQAQTLYPSIIYYEDEAQGELLVSQYIPSALDWHYKDTNIRVEQTTNMKYYNDQAFFDEQDQGQMSRWLLKLEVHAETETPFVLSLRIPEWVKGQPVVHLDGKELSDLTITDGYLHLSEVWKDQQIELYLPDEVKLVELPDQPEMVAVMEGPVVLAGLCDSDKGLHGDRKHPETFLRVQREHTYETYPWRQSTYRTYGQTENILFRPLYELTDETYTVYFTN